LKLLNDNLDYRFWAKVWKASCHLNWNNRDQHSKRLAIVSTDWQIWATDRPHLRRTYFLSFCIYM